LTIEINYELRNYELQGAQVKSIIILQNKNASPKDVNELLGTKQAFKNNDLSKISDIHLNFNKAFC
jgi:hypothetical protein